ncbi:hypothetical protein CCAX7_004040 [Capsulimonas corticalis]|uniref:DUF4349 domain-containing protein n=1 Tax=Capsulimonas corticalis TaxID=2219043 RepID=A0A402D2W9_9BACT|nr:DUF4349 domain-containing protein [Capsulimonas corticalis]BDI28353.1 hypothetical protein CCAX7_004040 [Capsulimonas corticalis]
MRNAAALAAVMLAMAGMRSAAQAPDASESPAPLIQRGGTVAVKVANYDAARTQVMESARMQGAELLEAKTVVNPKGAKNGWISFSLPAERVGAFLPVAYGLGKLYSEHMTATNNDSEHDMLARRVVSLQQHETRLGSVLQSPRRMRGSDILYLQERLFRANVDEGVLRQQRIDLERNSRVSTVTVEMFEPGAVPVTTDVVHIDLRQWFAASALRAREGFGRQLARAATVGAYALVYAPIWVPLLLITLLLLAWLWRRRQILLNLLHSAWLQIARLARLFWEYRNRRIEFGG